MFRDNLQRSYDFIKVQRETKVFVQLDCKSICRYIYESTLYKDTCTNKSTEKLIHKSRTMSKE